MDSFRSSCPCPVCGEAVRVRNVRHRWFRVYCMRCDTGDLRNLLSIQKGYDVPHDLHSPGLCSWCDSTLELRYFVHTCHDYQGFYLEHYCAYCVATSLRLFLEPVPAKQDEQWWMENVWVT